MIKKLALVLAITAVTAYSANIAIAAPVKKSKTISVSPSVYSAVQKYKQKNYTGCIQDLTPIAEKDENNALVQYYLGISYAQLGIKDKAEAAYSKVIELDNDKKLVEYSKRAQACLNEQPQCSPNYSAKDEKVDDMTVFIQSGKFMHDDVKQQVQEKSLDKVKDSINNDQAPHAENYKYINDASSQMKNQPTDAEIANAVRVLARAGVNPFGGFNGMKYANPEIAQVSAMLGNSNSNNAMDSYLPYVLSQGAKANPDTTKQMLQAMMMSQMMPDLGFNNTSKSGF